MPRLQQHQRPQHPQQAAAERRVDQRVEGPQEEGPGLRLRAALLEQDGGAVYEVGSGGVSHGRPFWCQGEEAVGNVRFLQNTSLL